MEQFFRKYLFHERKGIRIYGPLFLSVSLIVLFFSISIEKPSNTFLRAFIPVIYSILIWASGRWLVLHCRKRIPDIRYVNKRIRLLIIIGIPLAAMNGFIDQLFSLFMGQLKYLTFDDYLLLFTLNIISCTLVVSIYESQYFLHQWSKLLCESENLKKKFSNSQFHFLKEQIKPHFLFNSLNTLSALIIINPVKAELYVEEMSTVYRYLLNKNEKDLTTLKEELTFLDSYLHLLRVRFERSLNVSIHISEELQEYLLPPFVLQLLIENAVKHNIISKEHPLSIQVYTDEENVLHVDNNLHLKACPENSERTGLANIRSRYALLNKEDEFQVIKENNFFKVFIPLIKKSRYEVSHLLSM